MTVRNEVYSPGIKNNLDPIKDKPQDAAIDWQRKAEEMAARKKYEVEKKELKDLESPPPPNKPEVGFTVKGGINLGEIDLMQQQRDAQTKMEEIQKKSEDQINSLAAETEHYREQVTELRIKALQDTFQLQMDTLMKQLANNSNSRGSLTQQLEELKATASILGYAPATPGVSDAGLQIQILKMQHDAAREEREFQWKMKQDEWLRDAKMKEIERDGGLQLEKLKMEKERNNMIASFPEMLGQSIARGLMSGDVPATAAPKMSNQPRQQPVQAIEAGVGDSGEVNCPTCGNIIAIAPDTVEGVCAGCGLRIPIKRKVQSE